MKKRIVIVGMTLLLCCMGGCLKDVPLTDAEMDAVAEYAAGLLLKHDVNYSSSLLPDDIMKELLTPSPTPSPTPTAVPEGANPSTGDSASGTNPSTTPVPEVTDETHVQLTELFGQEGFEISYDRYEISDSIVSSSYFVLEAKDGCQYVTTYFTIRNLTQEELAFDASGQKITYTLDVNVTDRYRAALSMLSNDMQYMEIKVPAGETVEAVLVFEVKAEKEEDLELLHLILSDDTDHSVFVKVK